MVTTRLIVAGVLALGLTASVIATRRIQAPQQTTAARFLVQIPWAGRGSWVKADTHIHTRLSDGVLAPEDIAAKAFEYGCQVIALSDHADHDLKAATPEYEAAISALRQKYSHHVILAGIEWNVPPSNGDEHAVVIVPPGPAEVGMLAEFKARFDDYERAPTDRPDVRTALTWLAGRYAGASVGPAIVYDHPSRKRAKSMDAVADIERWRRINDLVVAIEGGPGHQGLEPPGDYRYSEPVVDRWDPAVARIGDVWDTLLQHGLDVGGAVATSDFHNESDGWPCRFAETWLYVPELSAAGALRALRAGSSFAVHGRIAREVELRASVTGLPRPAVAGEVIEAPAGAMVNVSLRLRVPERDWLDRPNRIDTIELITISSTGAVLASSAAPKTGVDAFAATVKVPAGGIVLRARGRRSVAGERSLLFYTNPIRIKTRAVK